MVDIMKRYRLVYSPLTDKVYWVDGKGAKTECTQSFIQVMLLWLHEGNDAMKPGDKFGRDLLTKDNRIDWTIIIERALLNSDKKVEECDATEAK